MAQKNYSDNPTVEFIKIAVSFPIFKYKREDSNPYFIVPFPKDLFFSFVLHRRFIDKEPLPKLHDVDSLDIPILTLEAYIYYLRYRNKYYIND